MRILLVEDNPSLRKMTSAYLTERGFVVDAAASVAEGRDALAAAVYDAMVLDLGLPDGDGTALLQVGAGATPPPALILTARDLVGDRISGLNAGADDYLVKPFDLAELEARLRAVLRRPGTRASVMLTLGRLTLDTISREVAVGGRRITLGRREGLLLEALLEAQGRVAVRDHLEERLYGFDEPVTPNALEAAVSRLRRALAAAKADLAIETLRGIGYRLQSIGRP